MMDWFVPINASPPNTIKVDLTKSYLPTFSAVKKLVINRVKANKSKTPKDLIIKTEKLFCVRSLIDI
tara:strand:+ start:281 stop:481 length:201 start_codon:yes stop_codon:yes gene_type:complete